MSTEPAAVRMRRTPMLRTIPASAVAALLLVTMSVAGCGSDDGTTADQQHPSGHDDLVVRIEVGGGMGSRESFFSEAPSLVVAGDGTVYLPAEDGSMSGIVAPLVTRRLSAEAVQDLLRRAVDDGLLGTPAGYDDDTGVSDGSTTSVTLVTDAGRWQHTAYALGEGGGSTDARASLVDFVDHALTTVDPATAAPYHPETLRILASPVEQGDDGATPTGRWPAGAGVDLAAAADCLVVDSPAAVRTLTQRPLRHYRQGRHVYSVAAAVSLPGDDCGGDTGS